ASTIRSKQRPSACRLPSAPITANSRRRATWCRSAALCRCARPANWRRGSRRCATTRRRSVVPAARPRITPRATRALRASSCAAFSLHNGSARFPDGLSGQKSPLPQRLRQGCSLFERNEVLPVIRSLPHAGVARAVGGREAQRMLAVAAEELVVEVVGVGALHAVFFQ